MDNPLLEGSKADSSIHWVKESSTPNENNCIKDDKKDHIETQERYSRLLALENLEDGQGIQMKNLMNETVVIVGVGGVGSVAAEMLCRCGLGKLILFDNDRVEMANMNRLFFRPDHIGLSKVIAAQHVLQSINPDVVVEIFDEDITKNYDILLHCIKQRGLRPHGRVSLLLSCVDNFSARLTINRVCNETNQIWLNAGVSEDAMHAQIQLCIPGYLACYQCAPPEELATATPVTLSDQKGSTLTEMAEQQQAIPLQNSKLDQFNKLGVDTSEAYIKGNESGKEYINSEHLPTNSIQEQFSNNNRENRRPCTASLPTTMTIAAGLLVHNALKVLLGFGNASFFLGFNSLQNFFPSLTIKPNPDCADSFCRLRQKEVSHIAGDKSLDQFRNQYLHRRFAIYDQLQQRQGKLFDSNLINMNSSLHSENLFGISCETSGFTDTSHHAAQTSDSLELDVMKDDTLDYLVHTLQSLQQ